MKLGINSKSSILSSFLSQVAEVMCLLIFTLLAFCKQLSTSFFVAENRAFSRIVLSVAPQTLCTAKMGNRILNVARLASLDFDWRPAQPCNCHLDRRKAQGFCGQSRLSSMLQPVPNRTSVYGSACTKLSGMEPHSLFLPR